MRLKSIVLGIYNSKHFLLYLFAFILIATFGLFFFIDSNRDSYVYNRQRSVIAQYPPNDERISSLGSDNSCLRTGVNTNTDYKNASRLYENTEFLGLGWVLSRLDSDPTIISNVCDLEANTILELCPTGFENCNLVTSEFDDFVETLNSLSCDIWLVPPTYDPNIQTDYNIFMNRLADETNDNTKLLSPLLSAANPIQDFEQGVWETTSWWNKIDGISVRTVGSDSVTGYESISENIFPKLSINRDVYVIRAGISGYSAMENTEREDAIENELETFYQDDRIVVALLDDVLGGNITNDDVIWNAVDPSGDYCNQDSDTSIETVEPNDNYSCCQWEQRTAIDSCEIVQGRSNGEGEVDNRQDGGSDELIAGVQLRPVPGSNNSQFEYHYVVTQQVHQIPLLNFLSSAEVDVLDDANNSNPIRNLQFTSPGAYLNQTSIYDTADFTNKFEGIAQFTKSDGTGVQISVPDLGTAAAIGRVNWMDFHQEQRLHCGLFFDENQNQFRLPFSSEVIIDSENLTNSEIRTNYSDVLTRFFKSETQFQIPETEFAPIEFFEEAIFNLQENIQQNRLQSVCTNACGDNSEIPLTRCVYEDTIVLDRDENEIVVDEAGRNSDGEWVGESAALSASDVCDMLFIEETAIKRPTAILNPICYMSDGSSVGTGTADASAVYQNLRSSGVVATSVSNAQNILMQVQIEKSERLELEGLLNMLENVYQIESTLVANQFQSQKICHYDNAGINVPVTRRIYDRNRSFSINIPDLSQRLMDTLIPENSEYLFEPSEQAFTLRDFDTLVGGSCQISSDPFRADWSLAKQWPKEEPLKTYNSQATVNYIFPWLGQIVNMQERISRSFQNTRPDRGLFMSRDDVFTFYAERIDNGVEELPVTPLPYCTQLESLDELWAEEFGEGGRFLNEDGLPIVDCICGMDEEDPLQEYLINYKVSEDPLLEQVDFSEAGGNYTDYGQAEQCRLYEDEEDIDFEDPDAELGSLAAGVVFPIDENQSYSLTRGVIDGSHPGIDLADTIGTPIYAVADGAVVFIRDGAEDSLVKKSDGSVCAKDKNNDGLVDPVTGNACDWYDTSLPYQPPWWREYGNLVVIKHDDFYSLYAHFDTGSVRVGVGDSVTAGEQIGEMGNTGNSTGSHLHFEMRTPEIINNHGYNNSDTILNPYDYFDDTVDVEYVPVERTDDLQDQECEIVDPVDRPPYEGSPLSGGLNCTIKRTADILNDLGVPISPEFIGAIVQKETSGMCTHKWINFPAGPACNGDPNQTGLTTRNGLAWEGRINNGLCPVDIRGIGQIAANIAGTNSCADTFNLMIARNYTLMKECTERLGVDNTIDQDLWRDPGSNYPDEFSRLRVADNLCFIGIWAQELVESNPARVTNIPQSPAEWNTILSDSQIVENSDNYNFNVSRARRDAGLPQIAVDPVTYVAGRYHGNCTLSYCILVHTYLQGDLGIYDNACEDDDNSGGGDFEIL